MTAIISPCGAFRYMLRRGEGPRCAVVLLNPSTADHAQDDATTRKLAGFARDWGWCGYDLFNTGAGRATDPREWARMPDPYGPDNALYLGMAAQYPLIVVGWGNEAPAGAVHQAVSILTAQGADLWCLGVNANGSPKHPLYVPYSQRLRRWRYT